MTLGLEKAFFILRGKAPFSPFRAHNWPQQSL
ncbi:hypothetical protein SGRA_2702 [Saprospira grandis str. Lewin]|uniref:Uncharacterized protein n=1 Tax=Saprospira grandis (strain Lewin) TaxID=984262 RepID=H6L9F4_SAPGL|nr:hypothetical protein SGRA_2702 [Saprospira grandis str. Lewin]